MWQWRQGGGACTAPAKAGGGHLDVALIGNLPAVALRRRKPVLRGQRLLLQAPHARSHFVQLGGARARGPSGPLKRAGSCGILTPKLMTAATQRNARVRLTCVSAVVRATWASSLLDGLTSDSGGARPGLSSCTASFCEQSRHGMLRPPSPPLPHAQFRRGCPCRTGRPQAWPVRTHRGRQLLQLPLGSCQAPLRPLLLRNALLRDAAQLVHQDLFGSAQPRWCREGGRVTVTRRRQRADMGTPRQVRKRRVPYCEISCICFSCFRSAAFSASSSSAALWGGTELPSSPSTPPATPPCNKKPIAMLSVGISEVGAGN